MHPTKLQCSPEQLLLFLHGLSLSRLQAASSAVLSEWFPLLKRTITTVYSASLFASELETEPVCPQPLCVLVATSVDKLLVQPVRLVHRFTSITADLVHTRLTIRLAAATVAVETTAHCCDALDGSSRSFISSCTGELMLII